MRKRVVSVGCVLVGLSAAVANGFPPFTPGNLVVSRMGDGTLALSSAAAPVFLDEFTTTGSSVGSLPLPTAASGLNHRFSDSGSATSDGALTLSTNGQYLTIAGYDASVGTASVASTTSAANPRVVGRIDQIGNIDTSTALSDSYSGNNVRSVVSTNGTDFWVAGTASSGGGVRYATLGGTSATQLSTTITNTRVVNIFSGQLFTSSSTGTFLGVSTVGSGTPTTSGQTITQLSGFPTTGSHSAYDYFFADASTLYVADDGSFANGGGLQKWTQSAGVWSNAYTLSGGLGTGLRGLTGVVNGGLTTLYAITAETSGNKLVSVTDLGVGSNFSVLATSPANELFRGVDFAPTPEPATLGMIALGALVLFRRRR